MIKDSYVKLDLTGSETISSFRLYFYVNLFKMPFKEGHFKSIRLKKLTHLEQY
jgi:hypothetical protein